VQAGAASLGLDPLDPGGRLTRTGGLSFAGAPWNSYVLHAIATLVGELRELPGGRALVWANGGFLTKHSFGVYGSTPPPAGFGYDSPQAAIDALPRRTLATGDDATGSAVVEAYTVMHDRDGRPQQALAACLRSDGRRVWGTSLHPDTAAALLEGEWVGRHVRICSTGGLDV
jgi:acetyl-CoA C-acetyltransferase